MNPELALQISVVRYLDTVLLPPAYYTAFPAGGGGRTRGALLKAAGLRAGMPDIIVMRPGDSPYSLTTVMLGIELKTAKGVVSRAQASCHDTLMNCGWKIAVCRSIEHVRAALEESNFNFLRHKL